MKYKLHVRVFLSRYRGYAPCPDCRGTRLRAEARAVKIAGRSITEVCQMTVTRSASVFASLVLTPAEASHRRRKFSEEIQLRLRFLDEVGLDYLTLDRLTSTLSGGEAQRIQLSDLAGLASWWARYTCWTSRRLGCIAADTSQVDPHSRGAARLWATRLLVVEHDPDAMRGGGPHSWSWGRARVSTAGNINASKAIMPR